MEFSFVVSFSKFRDAAYYIEFAQFIHLGWRTNQFVAFISLEGKDQQNMYVKIEYTLQSKKVFI